MLVCPGAIEGRDMRYEAISTYQPESLNLGGLFATMKIVDAIDRQEPYNGCAKEVNSEDRPH
jgi:hypothetical protein